MNRILICVLLLIALSFVVMTAEARSSHALSEDPFLDSLSNKDNALFADILSEAEDTLKSDNALDSKDSALFSDFLSKTNKVPEAEESEVLAMLEPLSAEEELDMVIDGKYIPVFWVILSGVIVFAIVLLPIVVVPIVLCCRKYHKDDMTITELQDEDVNDEDVFDIPY